jgi:broad specificity phosphatase PhoE
MLLVTHGGVIRHLLCLMLGLPMVKYLVFDVQPGCFCSLQVYSDGSVLTGFNLKG